MKSSFSRNAAPLPNLATKASIKAGTTRILARGGPEVGARFLAMAVFAEKTDRAGVPYTEHLRRVAEGLRDTGEFPIEKLRAIAWLHDLLEDFPEWTADDLCAIGFDDFVVDGVVAMTKSDENAPYFDEVVRLCMTPQAIPVKKVDWQDNSNLLRETALPSRRDLQRVRKYFLATRYADAIDDGLIAPGTPFAVWMAAQPAALQNRALLEKHSRHAGLFPDGRARRAPAQP